MPRGKAITGTQFHSIKRGIATALQTGDRDFLAIVARAHGVSNATVYKVHNAKSWPRFQEGRSGKSAIHLRIARARRAGLNPVRRITGTVEETFEKDLIPISKFVARDEFDAAIHLLNERLDVHNFVIQKKADKKERRGFWGRR